MTRTPRLFTVRVKSADLGFDWRDRKTKFYFIFFQPSANLRKITAKSLTQGHLHNIRILSGGSPIKEKQGGTLSLPCPRRAMQGHSFWLAVRLNTGLEVWFLYLPTDDCALGPLVQRFFWLANRSHVFRDLDLKKEDPEKGIDRLKAGSADRRLEALGTLFTTIATYPESSTWPSLVTLVCSKQTRG